MSYNNNSIFNQDKETIEKIKIKNNKILKVLHKKLIELYINNKTSDSEKKVISERLSELLSITEEFFNKIKFAMNSLDELFAQNVINKSDKLAISFNGGKDCLAAYIVIKYYFFCKKFAYSYDLNSFVTFCNESSENKENHYNLKETGVYFIYFLNDDYFKEEEDYVIDFIRKEKIDSFCFYSDIVTGLKFLIQNYDLKFVIMGVRDDDVSLSYKQKLNSQNLLHPSTNPYPTFLRFYPIYNFTFEDVWKIILVSNYKYLELYDKGFSSIGKKHNTMVNQNLIINNSILPAWCLKKYDSEREFRK